MRGNGFVNQTQDFVRGYIRGFCSDPSEAGGGGSDADQAAFRCDKGPEDAGWEPGKIPDSEFWTPKLGR
jgi:hypothetical protein